MRPMIRPTLACATVFGFLFLMPADPGAMGDAPGDLDPTFSGDGVEITHFGGYDVAHGVAVQRDGKIVVVGVAGDFALARYNTDGSLDASFSGDGKLITDFGSNGDVASGVAIDSTGPVDKIVVVGSNGGDFVVARYNADGSLDTTFSDDGQLTTDFDGTADGATGVAIAPDGKIVAVGFAGFADTYDFALARYNQNGSLDTSFSSDGMHTTDMGGGDVANGMALQPDGKIVVVGYALSGFDSDSVFTVARYNSDGSLDAGFAGAGIQTTDFGWNDGASSVALQSDGKIVAVGYGNFAFALARYNVNGSLDENFSGDGQQTTSFEGTSFGCRDGASGVAIQLNGKIVAVGSDGCDFAVGRYNSDGSLDATFSGDGKQTTDFGSTGDVAYGVAIDPNDPDGKIVVVGRTYNSGTGSDFTLARYHGGLGSSDTTPPETTIAGGPAGTTNAPTFSFDASEDGSTFKCRVDYSGDYACLSPHMPTLSDGPHTFEVWATDPSGNADQTPAGLVFSVDTAPPETSVTSGPAATTNDSSPTFFFGSSEESATFICRVDANTFTLCNSPHTYSQLGAGAHSFQVYATDGAGNTDPTPASHGWTIVSHYGNDVLATSGLVSYWRLGDTFGTTAADAKGANNGSYRNGVMLGGPSALIIDSNASASFDGSNDYVSVADSASLHVGDPDVFTLEAWIRRSGTSSSTKTVLSKGNGSFRLSFVNNVLTLTKNNAGTVARASVSTTDTTGFHHVVATKAGATVKLYIDGADQTGTVTNRTIANTSTRLNIGRDTAGSEYFPGLIDEVAIYKVALSAAQVQQHFKASGR